jgi:integrase
MRITFYLDKPQAATSAVMLNISVRGKRLRFGTGISLDPRHWNDQRQEPRSSDPLRNAHLHRLVTIRATVTDIYNTVYAGGSMPNDADSVASYLRESVRSFLSPEHQTMPASTTLEARFEEFIATHTIRSARGLITSVRPSDITIGRYRHVLETLVAWSAATSNNLRFEGMTVEFYLAYSAWLSKTRSLSDATVSNYIKTIKTFLRWARYKGYHANTDYEQFYRDKRTGETLALTVDDVRTLRDVDLSDAPRLARVRDHFLLQCYTGMRYGDLQRLEPRHMDEDAGVIRFTTEKTNTRCIIPITRPLRDLLVRYPSRHFEFVSGVKQNVYLKELGQRVGMMQDMVTERYVQGRRVEEVHRKYELLTTHVARRSFATLSVRFGIPEAVIGIVMGHSRKGMLQQHYVKLDEEAVRDMVVQAWERL